MKAKIIAFCGVDGSGKTSLINMLERAAFLPNAIYVHKKDARNLDLVKKYHRRLCGFGKEWEMGSFAHSAGFAAGLDFLQHYDDRIEPSLGVRKYIISDRYVLCYAAYLRSTGGSIDIDGLFANVQVPDVIVFVEAPFHCLAQRYQHRGGPGEDETEAVMRRFYQGYKEIMRSMDQSRILTVMNDANLDTAYLSLTQQLARLLDRLEA